MPTALRAFVVIPVSLILFAFAGAAFAQLNADEADDMCPPVTENNVYKSYKTHLAEFEENGKKYFNLYGTICKDIEGKQVAANGICVDAHVCQASFCGGKPCALPPIQMKDVQKSVYGDSSPTTPAPTVPPNTGGSLFDQMLLKPLDQPKTELSPPADSFKKILEQGKEPGVVDKLWNYVFQPTPINPDKEISQLQPTKYDDFGNVIPQTVGPQNTITNPNSTFGEPQTAAPSTETPWWESAWNGTKEIASNTWGAITKEFGFETQAAPEQVASEEKSGSQASGFAESAALRDEKSMTDENAQIPGDQIAEVKKGPAETTRDLALNSGPTEDMSTDQSTSRTAEEIKKDALRPTATGIMTGYNPEKPGERSGGRGLATGGTYDPNAWEVAIRTDIGKSTGCGVGGGSICYALIESPDGKAAIVRVPDNGPLSGQGISASEYRVVDLNQKVGEYFSGSTDVNNIKLENMKVTLLSGDDYQVGPIAGNTPEMPYSQRPAGSYIDQQPLQNVSYYGEVANTSANMNGGWAGVTSQYDLYGESTGNLAVAEQGFQNHAISAFGGGWEGSVAASATQNQTLADNAAINSFGGGWEGMSAGSTQENALITENNILNGFAHGWEGSAAISSGQNEALASNSALYDFASGWEGNAAVSAGQNQTLADDAAINASAGGLEGMNAGSANENATANANDILNNFNNPFALTDAERQKLIEAGYPVSKADMDTMTPEQLRTIEKQMSDERGMLATEQEKAYLQALKDSESKVPVPETVVVDAQKSVEEANAADQQARDAKLAEVIRSDQAAYDAADKQARDEKLAEVIRSDQAAWEEAARQGPKEVDQKVLDSIKKEQVAAQAAVDAAQKRLDAANNEAEIAELTGGRQCIDTGFIQCPATAAAHQLAVAQKNLETVKSNYELCQAGNCPGSIVDAKAQAEKGQGATSAWFKGAEDSFAKDMSMRISNLRNGTLLSPVDLAYTLSDGLGYAATWGPRTLLEGTTVGEYLGFRGTPDEVIGNAANPGRELEDKITAARDIAMITVPVAADLSISSKGFSALGNWTTAGREAGSLGADLAPAAGAVEREIAAARPPAPVDTVPPATDVRVLTSEPAAPAPRLAEPPRVLTQAELDQTAIERMAGEGPTPVKTPAAESIAPKAVEPAAPADVVPVAEKSWLGKKWEDLKSSFGYGEKPPAPTQLTQAERDARAIAQMETEAPVQLKPGAENPSGKVWNDPMLTKDEFVADYKAVYPKTGLTDEQLAAKFDAGQRLNPETRSLKQEFTTKAPDLPAEPAPEVIAPKAAVAPEVAPAPKAVEPVTPAPEVASAAEKPWYKRAYESVFGKSEPPAAAEMPKAAVAPEAAPAPKTAEAPTPRAEPAPAETTPPARGAAEPTPVAEAPKTVEPAPRISEPVRTRTQAELDQAAIERMAGEGPVAQRPGAENPSGKAWNDRTLTRDEFIADYKATYPKTTLSDAQLAERYAAGQRLNPATGRLKVPETPAAPEVAVPAPTTPVTAVAREPIFRPFSEWTKTGKLVIGGGAVIGGLALYNNLINPNLIPVGKNVPAPEKKNDVTPPPPKAEVPPPVVRKDVVPPPVTRTPCGPNDTFASSGCYPPYGSSAPTGPVFDQDYYCITSINPVVVVPVPAGTPFPTGKCYNSPGGGSTPSSFGNLLGQMLGKMFGTSSPAPTTPTTPPVSPPPTQPTTTPTVAKPYATLIAHPTTVPPGGKSRLIWSSVKTSSCELFAPENVSIATGVTGATSTPALATTTQFVLNCSATSGATTSAQTTVTVH